MGTEPLVPIIIEVIPTTDHDHPIIDLLVCRGRDQVVQKAFVLSVSDHQLEVLDLLLEAFEQQVRDRPVV